MVGNAVPQTKYNYATQWNTVNKFYTADKFDTTPNSFPDVKYAILLEVLIRIYTVLQKPGMAGLKQAF